MNPDGVVLADPELIMLRNNKIAGVSYRERRQADWTENYTLYRDKVLFNRLTQRQTVNLPVMKLHIRTLLKDVDDMPVMYFENRDNDEQAEIFENAYWKRTLEVNNADLKDIVDKKQVFMFGRSFDSWQIIDGEIRMFIEDPECIVVDQWVDPTDLDSCEYLIHMHIFKPLSTLEDNPDYDPSAIAALKKYYLSQEGLIKIGSNQQSYVQMTEKMRQLGFNDIESPILGETYVELSIHFVRRKEEGDDQRQFYVYVEAEDMQILMKKRLEEIIGSTKDHYWRTHLNYNSWADDVDKQDFWTDGVADIVRSPNKVINSWFSQMVENRVLRNFGMNYYDGTIEGFVPQTYSPIPGGWYPTPGKPDDVMKKVDVPDLSDSLDEMNFILTMLERATGAVSTEQGAPTERQITLGEVKLALSEAKDRIKGMSKYYTPAWKKRAEKFQKMVEAAPEKLDAVQIYQKGRNSSKIFTRQIQPSDWLTATGSNVQIWSQDDKDNEDTNSLQKLAFAKQNMPQNPKLQEVINRKSLEFAKLKPDEINEIMQYQLKQDEQAGQQTTQGSNESIAINYKDAPPDIQRQMEIKAGFQPSQTGVVQTGQPGQIPGIPGGQPSQGSPAGGQGVPQIQQPPPQQHPPMMGMG